MWFWAGKRIFQRNRAPSLKTSTHKHNVMNEKTNNSFSTSNYYSSSPNESSSTTAAKRRHSIATTNYDHNLNDKSDENDGDRLLNIYRTDTSALSAAAISAMRQSEVPAGEEGSSNNSNSTSSGTRGVGRMTEGRSNSSFGDNINSCTQISDPTRGSSRRNSTFQSLTCDTSSSCEDSGHPNAPPPAVLTTKVSISSCDYSYCSILNTTTPKEEVTATAATHHTDDDSTRWTSCCSRRSELSKKNASDSNSNIEALIPTGYKLRDEFVCPITRELIMDPVIAADGHTYDLYAIERWLQTHVTSPKTGQPLDHMHLVPNHNLQRLLRDMLREGGQALFCPEEDGTAMSTVTPTTTSATSAAHNSPQIALVREYVLKCKCLGPSESDWMGRTFRVTSYQGVLGGRRRPEEFSYTTTTTNNGTEDPITSNTSSNNRKPPPEFVQFSDATVSRKHFEIRFIESKRVFAIRDCGSAGGTFLRIPPCQAVPVYPGMRIMLGKHQLEVCDPPRRIVPNTSVDPSCVPSDGCNREMRQPPLPPTTISNFEHTMTEVNTPYFHNRSYHHAAAANARRRKDPSFRKISATDTKGTYDYDQDLLLLQKLDLTDGANKNCQNPNESLSDTNSVLEGSSASSQEEGNKRRSNDRSSSIDPPSTRTEEEELKMNIDHYILSLKCFAPEGTPIQGKEYFVGREGATIGRKVQNTISFCHRIGDSYVGIDNSISGEHANITYNEQKGILELRDGSMTSVAEEQGGRALPSSGSTNGTWIRLSGLHEESDYHYLHDKTEILIGTVRFLVSMEEVIVERDIYSDSEGSIALL